MAELHKLHIRDHRTTIECPTGTCGVIECDGTHNPTADEEEDALFGNEIFLHGELHTYQSEIGWAVPYNRCAVNDADYFIPETIDTGIDGTYDVEADWGDYTVHLTLARKNRERRERSI